MTPPDLPQPRTPAPDIRDSKNPIPALSMNYRPLEASLQDGLDGALEICEAERKLRIRHAVVTINSQAAVRGRTVECHWTIGFGTRQLLPLRPAAAGDAKSALRDHGIAVRLKDMKRVLCALLGHRYLRIRYPGSPDGYYLRCDRCAKERDETAGGGGVGTGALGR